MQQTIDSDFGLRMDKVIFLKLSRKAASFKTSGTLKKDDPELLMSMQEKDALHNVDISCKIFSCISVDNAREPDN